MTTLELILIIFLWIGYGILAVNKTKISGDSLVEVLKENEDAGGAYFLAFCLILFSPAVLIYRAIYGMFKTFKI